MFNVDIKEIVEVLGKKRPKGIENIPASGISIDSRTISKGQIFVAVRGQNFNGADYAKQAVKKGAALVILQDERKKLKENLPCIFVKDTYDALQKIASFNRSKFNGRVVAVTGSSGKTITKEMLSEILSVRGKVTKTEGNKNNHIGVPLALLDIDEETRFAVIEMGMNHMGEIKKLSDIARPDVGVILNVLRAHIGFFSDLRGISRAKAEIISGIKEEGVLILNAEDKNLLDACAVFQGRKILFGISNKADVKAENIHVDELLKPSFELVSGSQKVLVNLRLSSVESVFNALAAASAAVFLGFKLPEIKEGLESTRTLKGRMEIRMVKDITIIDDTYNANPDSVKAALNNLQGFESKGRKIFVLGEMCELGKNSRKFHREVGSHAVKCGVSMIIAVGNVAAEAGLASVQDGIKSENVHLFESNNEAGKFLADEARAGDAILLKGSRLSKVDEVVEWLVS
ncbi:MAG: UDP-N-acetylmuramoyl-tripeptide--D-alanyl-D-alanine ligase [Candidatus Aureabacteria bacterium]|nr:UDP-N-acetylmuramoyl-tripeptide--D-alanyl-D-alanine ligase [Candidatus Auribacterota bacterium]